MTWLKGENAWQKLNDLFARSNLLTWLSLFGMLLALVWFYYNAWVPIQKFFRPSENSRFTPITPRFRILSAANESPSRECQSRISVPSSPKETVIWTNGTKFFSNSDTQVETFGSFLNLNFQPGIGFVVTPLSTDVLTPALFLSVLELRRSVDLDLMVNHVGIGAGLSYRLPLPRLTNTFLGLGAFTEYRDIENPFACIYGKVNF